MKIRVTCPEHGICPKSGRFPKSGSLHYLTELVNFAHKYNTQHWRSTLARGVSYLILKHLSWYTVLKIIYKHIYY